MDRGLSPAGSGLRAPGHFSCDGCRRESADRWLAELVAKDAGFARPSVISGDTHCAPNLGECRITKPGLADASP